MVVSIVLSYGCSAPQLKVVSWNEEPQTYRRIQILTDKLVRVMDRQNMYKYRYSVIENDMPQAYAVCNNHTMLVYRGVLNDFNDNELMFILAHEIYHIKSGHCQERTHASESYIRKQELEADLEAVKVVQKHFGIPASVYLNVIVKLKEYTKEQGHGEGKGFDTHPAFNERITKIIQFDSASHRTGGDLKDASAIDTETAKKAEETVGMIALAVSPLNGSINDKGCGICMDMSQMPPTHE